MKVARPDPSVPPEEHAAGVGAVDAELREHAEVARPVAQQVDVLQAAGIALELREEPVVGAVDEVHVGPVHGGLPAGQVGEHAVVLADVDLQAVLGVGGGGRARDHERERQQPQHRQRSLREGERHGRPRAGQAGERRRPDVEPKGSATARLPRAKRRVLREERMKPVRRVTLPA